MLPFLLMSCHENEQKPNILFILADDLCHDVLGYLTGGEVITPSIDELARRGTVFTTTYNMGGWNGAICIASRTMFTTGRFLWRAEEAEPDLRLLAAEGKTWSQEMARMGYETYMTGKWHVKIPPGKIFDHVGTERPGMPGDTPEGYHRPRGRNDTLWQPWDRRFGGFWEGGTHWSEVVANETITFLDSASNSDNPFFMYVAFNAPHDPRQSPREYVEIYSTEEMDVPPSFLPDYPYKEEMGCRPGLRDEMLAPFPRTEYAVRVHRQEYYAIITHMDAQIGRILERLKEHGMMENTYIFFTSDHGLSVGHHGLLGKQNMYDHSMRSPLIVAGPDIPEAEEREMAVYLQDIVPTAIELAGGEIPSYVEFSSLKELVLQTRNQSYYDAVYGAYMDRQRMIRVGDFKLIVYPYAGVRRLFHLEEDPEEMNDLAGNSEQEERVGQMHMQLKRLMKQMGDTLDLDSFDWR